MPTSVPVTAHTRHARGLFAGLPSSYQVMATALSFGQDGRWRRFMVSRLRAPAGGRVLDVATGAGMVAREVVRRWGAAVVGLDQSEPMLRGGLAETRRAGMAGRVRFVLGHGERLPFADGTFDGLTFTYLLRYVDDPEATLAELARVVRPGGKVANLEFHVPSGPGWRPLWWLYTRVGLPLAGVVVSRAWWDVGRFLGPSIEGFYRRHPLPDQLAMWRAAGLTGVRARTMSLGGGVVIWGTKAGVPAQPVGAESAMGRST